MTNQQNFHDHPGFPLAMKSLLMCMTRVDVDAVDAMYRSLIPEGGTIDDIEEIPAGAATLIQAAELVALGILMAERWIAREKAEMMSKPDEFQAQRDSAPFN